MCLDQAPWTWYTIAMTTTEARATHYCIDGCGLELWGTTPTRCLPCAFRAKRERDAKLTPRELYARYLDEGLADTDGHWAPIDFESFTKLLAPRQVEAKKTMNTRHGACNHPRTKAARAACRREATERATDSVVTHAFVFVRKARAEGCVNVLNEMTLWEVAQEYNIEGWDFKLACRMVRDRANMMNEWDLLHEEMLQVKR